MTPRAAVPMNFVARQHIAKGNGSFADSLTPWIASRRAISNDMLLSAGVQTSLATHWRPGATRKTLNEMKDGSITASFQWKGKSKVSYSHRQHTKAETR